MKPSVSSPTNKLGSFPIFNVISSTMLVLFVMGLFGLLLIHANKLTKAVQENVTVQVFLNKHVPEDELVRIDQFLNQQPYVLRQGGASQLVFISKQEAAEAFIKETGENFIEILQENPLRDSYLFRVDSRFQDAKNLQAIKQEISDMQGVFEVAYLENLVMAITKNVRHISMILIFFTVILLVVVVMLINNTIKLALYSQRFLIRSMNLVGATANFIRSPFLVRAIVIGLLAGTLADLLLLSLLYYANLHIDSLPTLQQPEKIFMLLTFIPLLGACIIWIGTYRAVSKYLYLSSEHLH
jgi:cell division transport system permease protein